VNVWRFQDRWKNHNVSDLLFGKSAPQKDAEFPSWNSELDDRTKRIFPVRVHFLQFLICLEKTEVGVFRVPCYFERGSCCDSFMIASIDTKYQRYFSRGCVHQWVTEVQQNIL
jgi:hypothetical protein